MSISNTTEVAILSLTFCATTWANYAINATATPETNIVCALHSADPGETGTMATTEIVYTSYARVNVARTTGGWTVNGTNGTCSPVAQISFVIAGAATTPTSAPFFSTGKSGGGASAILWSGSLVPSITISTGVTPVLTTSTTITLDSHWFATVAALALTALSSISGMGLLF